MHQHLTSHTSVFVFYNEAHVWNSNKPPFQLLDSRLAQIQQVTFFHQAFNLEQAE